MRDALDLNQRLQELEAPPFRIEGLPDVRTLDGRTEWLLDGLIPRGAITLLTGDSGVGKSTLALAIAGAVAHGQPCLGCSPKQARALYVDGENPLHVAKERLERLGIASTDALHIWGGWNDPTPTGPDSPEVIEFARERSGLIVYDSLIQFHRGSEQDSSETRRYLNQYRHLANQGAAVLLLHHTGKGENAKQYRGSSDIKAAVDQAFCLELIGEAERSIRTLRLTPFKSRIAHVDPLRIEWSEQGFRLSESRIKTNREIVEGIIAARPDMNGKEIVSCAQAAGVAKNRSEALLVDGVRDGWLSVSTGLRNSKTYRLAGEDSPGSWKQPGFNELRPAS